MNDQTKKELLRYLDFHGRASASGINCVNTITSSIDLLSSITESLSILKRDYSVLFYSGKSTDTRRFIAKLAEDLRHEKTVLIVADTLDFDPVIYDQLVRFREKNDFSVDANKKKFPSSSKIFLFFREDGGKNKDKLYEISDHVLEIKN